VRNLLGALVRGWKSFAHRLGRIQTWIILSLLYFLVVPVFSLIRFKDPLGYAVGEPDTWWEEMEPVDENLEDAGRRF
jgi:hypothetical protein